MYECHTLIGDLLSAIAPSICLLRYIRYRYQSGMGEGRIRVAYARTPTTGAQGSEVPKNWEVEQAQVYIDSQTGSVRTPKVQCVSPLKIRDTSADRNLFITRRLGVNIPGVNKSGIGREFIMTTSGYTYNIP